MININLENNRDLYVDYEESLKFLQSLDESLYEYPSETTYFHLYSEIKNDLELMAVKSYFATQNLEKTQLILWSDYDVTKNERLKPFRDLINFKVYKPLELAKGTPLEGNNRQLLATDTRHYMMSGMLRFLATYVKGGIWYDMDMILLRDFVPILDQEFAYSWGGVLDFSGFGSCAALMGINKGSEHSGICLDEISRAPIRSNTVCRDRELLAGVYRRKPFTVFPTSFFNTEWMINQKYPGLANKFQTGWFNKNDYSEQLFPGAFAWHWHNGGGINKYVVQPGSKFHILVSIIDRKLKERNLV